MFELSEDDRTFGAISRGAQSVPATLITVRTCAWRTCIWQRMVLKQPERCSRSRCWRIWLTMGYPAANITKRLPEHGS